MLFNGRDGKLGIITAFQKGEKEFGFNQSRGEMRKLTPANLERKGLFSWAIIRFAGELTNTEGCFRFTA